MGKPIEEDLIGGDGGDPESGVESSSHGRCCCHLCRWCLGRAFTFRCVVVLVLSVCVFLSAVFWLPPFRALVSGPGAAAAAANSSAPIQASFILQKPVSLLIGHIGQLEFDIFDEIGVPNTEVSIISMHPFAASNSTYVVFGVLPHTKHATTNPVVLSLLRSSMIDLVLQQSNLTLTSSLFGQPSSFEILEFPGGITVIPMQSAPIWQITQILFNFTLNNSIFQIQKNLNELKGQLKLGLNLRSYENVYVQMTNVNGSTVEPPVTVQASVLSDIGSHSLLPPRLKQLAQMITGSPARNLGLDHSVFGKVKGVQLSSYLNHSITSLVSPSPSPSPSEEPPNSAPPDPMYPALSPSYSPAPSINFHIAHAPAPQDRQIPSSPRYSDSPAPSAIPIARAPRQSPCHAPVFPPNVAPITHSHPPASNHLPHAPVPSPHVPLRHTPKVAPDLSSLPPGPVDGMRPQYDKGSGKAFMSPTFLASSIAPSPS